MGLKDKGEAAIIAQENALTQMTKEQVAANYPRLVECFTWIQSIK